jgi:hypothetical protein
MISFSPFLSFTISLRLTKICSLVMGNEIHYNFLVIAGHFVLILPYTTFDYHKHVVIRLSFTINYLLCLILFKRAIVKYFPPLFYIILYLHLFKIKKNLLKLNIYSNLLILRFPEAT